jgi:hypothetical protein
MAKVMSIPILREIAASFPQAFGRTGTRVFREVWLNEPGDVHTPFMLPQYVVERWREALLWSWAVGRLGGDDDSWDSSVAWSALGFPSEPSIRVEWIQRDTLNGDRVRASLAQTGHGMPGGTSYFFGAFTFVLFMLGCLSRDILFRAASGDGYPFFATRHGASGHPNLDAPDVCTLARDECFPRGLTTASAAFQHLAFAKPECGDCRERLSPSTGSSRRQPGHHRDVV